MITPFVSANLFFQNIYIDVPFYSPIHTSNFLLTAKNKLMLICQENQEYMQLNPGDEIDFIILEDGEVYMRSVTPDVRELKGQMKKSGRKPVSFKEMEKAVSKRTGKSR